MTNVVILYINMGCFDLIILVISYSYPQYPQSYPQKYHLKAVVLDFYPQYPHQDNIINLI